MTWATFGWITLGTAIGVAGYWAYDHYFSTAASAGRALLLKFEGDIAKVRTFIEKL